MLSFNYRRNPPKSQNIFGDIGFSPIAQPVGESDTAPAPTQLLDNNHKAPSTVKLGIKDEPIEESTPSNKLIPQLEVPIASETSQAPPRQSSLPKEKELFKELAQAYNFSNPRLLWRLYMGWKLLKSLTLGATYVFEDVEIPMQLLFWREWLRQQSCEQRMDYSDWMENKRNRSKPHGMQNTIYEVVQSSMRLNWEKAISLIGIVDAVLLPASPNIASSPDKPKKQIKSIKPKEQGQHTEEK